MIKEHDTVIYQVNPLREFRIKPYRYRFGVWTLGETISSRFFSYASDLGGSHLKQESNEISDVIRMQMSFVAETPK